MNQFRICGFVAALTVCFLAFADANLSGQELNGFSVPDSNSELQRTPPQDIAASVELGEVSEQAPPAPTADDANQAKIVSSTRVTDMLRRGGVLMIPIGVCSLILLVFVFERFVSLRKGIIIPGPFVSRVLEQVRSGELNRESAMSLCERNGSAIANVFKAGFSKWGRPSVEIEQAVLDEGERESNRLRRYLRLINGVATVCPLLGMLGTVLGMIHAFDAIAAAAQSQTEPGITIATGISQALLTTAAGLTVAIPALIAYLFFSGRADRHVMELDSLGMKVVNLVSAEAIALNQKNSKPKSRKAA